MTVDAFEEDEEYEYEYDLENIEWEETVHEEGETEQEQVHQQLQAFHENDTIEFEYEEETIDKQEVGRGKRKGEKLENIMKKQRTMKILITDAYEIALHRCQEDLNLKIGWLKDVMEYSTNDILASVMQSLLPMELLNATMVSEPTPAPIKYLESLARWMKATFKLIPNQDMTFEEGRDGSPIEDLLEHVIPNRTGSLAQITQLWFALLKSCMYQCRLVASIDPASLSPYEHPDLYTYTTVNGKESESLKSSDASQPVSQLKQKGGVQKRKESQSMAKVITDDKLLLWTEIWLNPEAGVDSDKPSLKDSTARWVPVSPFFNMFNAPEKIESCVRKGKVILFAIAIEPVFDEESHIQAQNAYVFMDVTARYNFKHNQMTKILAESYALCRKWLQHELDNMSSATNINEKVTTKIETRNDGSLCIDLVDSDDDFSLLRRQQSRKVEKAQLIQSELENKKHSMPKTFAEFKDHPIYLLERHLLSDEVIHPDKRKNIVGVFKGETIYLQNHREKLKTKIQWRKEMRKVLIDAEPIKVTKRQVRKKSSSKETNESDQVNLVTTDWKLFGIWQTEPYEVSSYLVVISRTYILILLLLM